MAEQVLNTEGSGGAGGASEQGAPSGQSSQSGASLDAISAKLDLLLSAAGITYKEEESNEEDA